MFRYQSEERATREVGDQGVNEAERMPDQNEDQNCHGKHGTNDHHGFEGGQAETS